MSAPLGQDVGKPPAVGWTGGLQRADTCGGAGPPVAWGFGRRRTG